MTTQDKSLMEFTHVEAIDDTDKALLCVIDGKKYWIPKSQIDEDSEVYKKGTDGTLIIPEWLATEKGLV